MLRRFFELFVSNRATENPHESHSRDIHVDLYVTQKQIDASEVVPLDVSDLGIVEVKIPRETEAGYIIRLSGALPNKGSVLAHNHVAS